MITFLITFCILKEWEMPGNLDFTGFSPIVSKLFSF